MRPGAIFSSLGFGDHDQRRAQDALGDQVTLCSTVTTVFGSCSESTMLIA